MADGLDFDTWISERFRALNTDESVFAPYVKSIVEGEESMEEKIDALDGILSELGDESLNVEEFRKEILLRWEQQVNANNSDKLADKGDVGTDIESKFKNMLLMNPDGTNTSASSQSESCGKGLKAPDSALRAAILNQYRDEESDDETREENGTAAVSTRGQGSSGSGGSNIERNVNAERVLNELKDKREREKAEAAKKRERDKEDRAKQKQQAQERKDKAKKKAAKVERKR